MDWCESRRGKIDKLAFMSRVMGRGGIEVWISDTDRLVIGHL